MPITLKKTIYVGLGGTGVQTLLHLKKQFINTYGEIPPMIKFIAFDTDTNISQLSLKDKYGRNVKLTRDEISIIYLTNADRVHASSNEYKWVPNDNVSNLQFVDGTGAGGIRSNGRFIVQYCHKTVENIINNLVTDIQKPLPLDCRFDVETNSTTDLAQPCHIHVFSSIAGGTGAGTLIDVLCLIQKALSGGLQKHIIIPWILTPDIFRYIDNSPNTNNVLLNAYCALRELDYIQNENRLNLNLDYCGTITKIPFSYAFIIQNKNKSQLTFENVPQIAQSMATSAFYASHATLGGAAASNLNNIVNSRANNLYDISNKKAWCSSVGSAELIYDNQLVASVYANRILSKLCKALIEGSNATGVDEAKTFVDKVRIRENEGRDDVINALLKEVLPPSELLVNRATTPTDIVNYINMFSDEQKLLTVINGNYKKKFDDVCTALSESIARLINEPIDGSIGKTIAFLKQLKEVIRVCRTEMTTEQAENLQKIEANSTINWSAQLEDCKGRFGRMDSAACEELSQKVSGVIKVYREELRRRKAIDFYDDLTNKIDIHIKDLNVLFGTLKSLSEQYATEVTEKINSVDNTSLFQIYLHSEEVKGVTTYKIDDSVKTNFRIYLARNGVELSQWLDTDRKTIKSQLWDFAESSDIVQSKLNYTIDMVLQKLHDNNPAIVQGYLNRLKELAMPMWMWDTKGQTAEKFQSTLEFSVGVANEQDSFLYQNDDYRDYYKTSPSQSITYTWTNQTDRICVICYEHLVPVFCIANIERWQTDTKASKNISGYLSAPWQTLMDSINFSIYPEQKKDLALDIWTKCFVFGLIKYDEDARTYWIESQLKGDALDDYRFDLAQYRDASFEKFKANQLEDEMKGLLDKKRSDQGATIFDKKLKEAAAAGSYRKDFASLSTVEQNDLKDSRMKGVANLLTEEINHITKTYR